MKKYLPIFYFLFSFFPLTALAVGFTNPLGNVTVSGILTRLITFILSFVVLLAIAGIVYGGFTYITSFGNDQRVAQAKKIILWAIVGLIVVVLSQLMVGLVGNLLGGGGTGKNPARLVPGGGQQAPAGELPPGRAPN